jgi:polyhydroxyalkanoate synthesis regulator phasin
MPSSDMSVVTDQDFNVFANQVKEVVIRRLVVEGKLDSDEATQFLEETAIMLVKRGWLGTKIDALLSMGPDDKRIQIVKIPSPLE